MQDLVLDNYKLIKIYVYMYIYMEYIKDIYFMCSNNIQNYQNTQNIFIDFLFCFVLDRKH